MSDRLLKLIVLGVLTVFSWCIVLAAADGIAHLAQLVLKAIGA